MPIGHSIPITVGSTIGLGKAIRMQTGLPNTCYAPVRRSNQLAHLNESIKTRERKRKKKLSAHGFQGKPFPISIWLMCFH